MTGIGVALVAIGAARGQESRPSTLVERVRAIVDTEMAAQQIPGAGVAIVRDGELVMNRGFGFADVEHSVAANEATVFRLGSISKCVTAVAVMQLVEQGRIELDGDARKWCPEFPDKGATISTRHLLGHLSGIRHYKPGEFDSTRHYEALRDTLSQFEADALLFEPGSRYGYTTYGYSVLGCIVEAASGDSFADYVRKRVFQPAGMASSQPDDAVRIIRHRARGYRIGDGGVLCNCRLADTSNKVPGGGMSATAGDVARFAMALFDGRLVRPATFAAMATPQKTASGAETGYGLGFGVSTAGTKRYVLHTGGQQGTTTVLCMAPERRAAAVFLTNLESVRGIATIGQRLVDATEPGSR